MPIDPAAPIEITAFKWVPPFAQGLVRDLRPRWACEELGLAYRERLIDVFDRPATYADEQPWKQVPYLRDGEIAMFETGAMLIHLAEEAGEALLPASGQPRAEVLSWLFAAYNSVEPQLFELNQVMVFAAKEDWAQLRKPSLLAAIDRRLAPLEARMAGREWIAGTFSIADIAMATALRELARHGVVDACPALRAYIARAEARPAFQTALAAQLAVIAANAPPPRTP